MTAGRPLKFKSAEELNTKIQAYFDSCFEEYWVDEPIRDENGIVILDDNKNPMTKPVKKKRNIEPITISGLAVALDTNRTTLLEYEGEIENRDQVQLSIEEKTKIANTIKKAKSVCEKFAEDHLFKGKNPAGAIFNLVNNYKEWYNKQHADITSGGKRINTNSIVFTDFSKKEDETEGQ